MSHSQLPWTILSDKATVASLHESLDEIICSTSGRPLAVEVMPLERETIEANARLIVKAVNHHAKLFRALAELTEWNANMGQFDAPVWERARAVLDAIRDERDGQQPVSDPNKLPELPNGELVCTCGCEDFRYVEDIGCWRGGVEIEEGVLHVNAAYETEGYDDGENPRLQCSSCVAEYAIPRDMDVQFN